MSYAGARNWQRLLPPLVGAAKRAARSRKRLISSPPNAMPMDFSMEASWPIGSDLETRIRNVTAVLGPTNTGKTHLAIERMLGHESGMIGLPLRLLAREVYDKISEPHRRPTRSRSSPARRRSSRSARAIGSRTVEAMPRDVDVDFLAIDEIQLAADLERGHVFTDRLLHSRGRKETLLLGAQTMREAIQDLIPGANFISRPRSVAPHAMPARRRSRACRHAPPSSPSRPARSTAIAELIRRQRGGAAVVLGALSPRTRNAQVALYQSGDVDFLVATDAIGMGLNLDVDHVAFSAVRKFDGHNFRNLTANEIGQIAGRAGRHMNDGTFGVTGNAEPFDADLIERLETHNFEPVRVLQWRNRRLDFARLDRLRDSLRELPDEAAPRPAPAWRDDVLALETVANDSEIADYARIAPPPLAGCGRSARSPTTARSPAQNHAELVTHAIYKYLDGPRGAHAGGLVRQQVGLRRSHRWRHRHAREPHRPHPHLDVCLEPHRLAERPGHWQGAHARHRGQPVRRAARMH